MCIIIASANPIKLEKNLLKRCWDRNPDGAGFAYVTDGRIKVVKELEHFERFHELFIRHLPVCMKAVSPMLLHFRVGTHGTKTIENVHPFWVARNCVMAHNGVLDIKEENNWSDTRTFAERVLKPISETHDFTKNDASIWLITKFAKSNKLAFLTSERNIQLINRKDGVESTELEAWFSNRTFEEHFNKVNRGGTYMEPDSSLLDELKTAKCKFCQKKIRIPSAICWLFVNGEVACNLCGMAVKAYAEKTGRAFTTKKTLEDTQEIPRQLVVA